MARGSSGKAHWAALRGDYLTAGDLFRLAGQPEKALEMYRRGRQHRLAAELAVELGADGLASREYELAGMQLPAAECALKAGDRDRAARLFVAGGNPRRAGEMLENSGRPGAAAVLFEHGGDHYQAARLFLEARQPEGAARALEALFAAHPANEDRSDLLGMAGRCGQMFLAHGQPEAGARWLEKAGRTREAAQAWVRAGQPERAVRAHLAGGEGQKAADLAESIPPDKIDPVLAAEAFQAAGRWGEAAALFLESNRHKDAATCLENLGCGAEAAWAHEAAGDWGAAAQGLERIGDLAGAADLYSRSGALFEAARCLEECGKLEEAAQAYLEAGDRFAAAILFERLESLDEALRILQSIPDDAPEAPAAALRRGRLLARKGLDSLAVDQFKAALDHGAASGPEIEVLFELALALERSSRPEEAAFALRRVVALDLHYADAARRLDRLERQGAPPRIGSFGALPARYRIEEPLVSPGPGEAFLAHDQVMDRKVVVRRLGPGVAVPGPAAERILADLRRVAQLHHPAIAAVYEAGQDEAGIFLVQEHVQGHSLRAVLAQEGPLDIPRAVQVLTRLAEALDYAHGLGLLSRTMRPESVLLTPGGDAKIVDFGLALRAAEGQAPQGCYRPPEAREGERMDPSSDMYLLGVLCWEMLLGAPPPAPAQGQTAPPVFPQLPERPIPDLLRRVVTACLAPRRSERLSSAQKLLEELHGTHLLPGALLVNRYEILREIGRGGMGSVFAARDLVLDEPVALKILAGPLDENTERRFIQEIRLTRQINHPNIVRVHTFERWRELRFIVMEYIDGQDLRRWAASRRPIPLSKALDIVGGVANGLAAAHRLGIVHRDVKPENVLVDREERPRLVDFGIARQGDIHLTREGLVMGSPAYMAPEQIRGQAADQRADLYALGILAFFLITGSEPFTSDNVADVLRRQVEEVPPLLGSLRPGVPQGLESLVARALSKDPHARQTSVFEFLEGLTAVRTQLTVVTA